MKRWARALYQPCLPLGRNGQRVTGCEEHILLSRKAAAEGMVLLKNEKSILPFEKGTRLALFGKGSVDYVKGGGGSDDVTTAYVRSLQDGLEIKEEEGKVQVLASLGKFYRENVSAQYAGGIQPGMTAEPEIPCDLLEKAKAWADAAVISICRFSGEGWDRKGIPGDGDFYLTREEQNMVDTVTANFEKVVVVLNVGGMVDTSWFCNSEKIQGVLLAWQGGMEGGLAAADLLCGDVNPSGKLTDTFARTFDDYPSSAGFNESEDYVDYTEDIYVGYRYFETIPGAAEKVNYPFGFGLSYTEFAIEPLRAGEEDGTICVDVRVTNMGSRAGKEVVQLYYRAPQGVLGKPLEVLGAFAKTELLGAGQSQVLRLKMPVKAMASYDDLGKIQASAYVLEAGNYSFRIGNSVRNTVKLDYEYQAAQTVVIEQLERKCAPAALKSRLLADGSYEELPQGGDVYEKNRLIPQDIDTLEGVEPDVQGITYQEKKEWRNADRITLEDVAEGKADLRRLLAQLSDRELAGLLGGQVNTGTANTYGMGNLPAYGIPNIMTADGPAGLRIREECGVYTTAWPCATLLACTWNPEMVFEAGAAGAAEVKENNIGVWLTPAMNIHRSPLCGRNFEYYSEDPLVSGKMGAAMIRGIQSQHIGASMKHFCCNNKETNRKDSDSRVSERALREIYLKGFEIAVKEAQPWTVMTSYNLMNGYPTSCNPELLNGILREEWGFEGMVTTDWWNHAEHYLEVKAGGDIKMGCGYPDRILEAKEKGFVSREEMEKCAERILGMILKVD
ncbi:glycoside hydrolase family 3 C-terminal domain-containing protein [Blautia sp. JLR.GB0024]|uniref:glycoside hydrolase family 3 protein n=1 Tax=Blautia sp. JLR.GB0024 TaxID=3123295 RepID=UPI003003AAE2